MTDSAPLRLTCAQVRALDRIAIEEYGLPGVVLMENAGAGAARIALDMLATASVRAVEILCGPGNNGGDGWVVARRLANAGARVRVATSVAIDALRGDAAIHARVAVRMGIEHEPCADAVAIARGVERWRRADLVVDALLGTGTTGAPRGVVRGMIEALEGAHRDVRILALDVPSGLDADTGSCAGAAVRAEATATFAAEKVGFDAPEARRRLGRVHVVDIGVPRALIERVRALT